VSDDTETWEASEESYREERKNDLEADDAITLDQVSNEQCVDLGPQPGDSVTVDRRPWYHVAKQDVELEPPPPCWDVIEQFELKYDEHQPENYRVDVFKLDAAHERGGARFFVRVIKQQVVTGVGHITLDASTFTRLFGGGKTEEHGTRDS